MCIYIYVCVCVGVFVFVIHDNGCVTHPYRNQTINHSNILSFIPFKCSDSNGTVAVKQFHYASTKEVRNMLAKII